MATFILTIKTLTPLHIGDGNVLRRDFDFAVYKGQTYRLNDTEILEAKEAQWSGVRNQYDPPGKLLTEADFSNKDFFPYIMRGMPRSPKTDAEVRAFIKDYQERPYIPGSSLKGAFRTALAWMGWKEIKPELNRQAIGRSRSWAGRDLEKKLFGRDPNHDLLRTLHVSDCFGPQKPGENLVLVNAQVLTKKSAQSPIELEAAQSETTFRGSVTIDDNLFGSMAEKELGFGNRRHWLNELMARTQAHSHARLEKLADWFEHADGAEQIAAFYRNLLNAKVGANTAVMQIGWGAGWDGKTLWTHLQQDPRLFEQLISDFRMHKAGRNSPPRKVGDPFPRSKRVAMDKANKPAAPMGWVLVQLKPVSELSDEWAEKARAVEHTAQPVQKVEKDSAPEKQPVVITPQAPAPQPVPEAPRTPPPPRAAPRPLIRQFTEIPKVGDRFKGTVIDSEANGKLMVEIPGLSPDDTAIGEVWPEHNPDHRRFREGAEVVCEVLAVKPDPHQKGFMLAQCARE